jgi:hypothetical protein
MKRLFLIVAAAMVVGCSAPHSSAAPHASTANGGAIMRHVLAINSCYTRAYIKAHFVDAAVDKHALRTCYNDTVESEQPRLRGVISVALVRVGRSCEHLIDPGSDVAMIAYRNCIFDALRKLGTPPPS